MSEQSQAKSTLYFPRKPESLHTHSAYLQLTSYDYDWRLYGSSLKLLFKEEAQSLAEKDFLSSPNKQIFLPIPNGGFGVQDTLIYDENKGGVTFLNKAASIMADSIQKAGIVGQIASAYSEVAATTFGKTINQFLVHTFKGISLRQYTYTWSLIPYSQEDAEELMSIIRAFRESSLPEYVPDNWTIKYPNFWTVRPYVNNKLFFEMNHLVISNIKIDFGGEGQVTFFRDGTPTQTTISLTFKEVYPQGSEVYKSGGRYTGEARI